MQRISPIARPKSIKIQFPSPRGAAYPAVNPRVVATQTIAIPTAEPVQQFHETSTFFFDLIERHRAQNQELTTLRDWLLPMLMNGQVRVTG